MRAAIFLDRDGTLFEDVGYPKDPDQVVFIPQAAQGLKQLQEKGYLLFVVSNQSGVARGIISQAQFEAVHRRCQELLQKEGIAIQAFFYCLHHPNENCGCRKPRPGLIPRQHQGASLDLARSFVIGDKACDVELGEAVGATGCLVLTGEGRKTAEALKKAGRHCPTFADLWAFSQHLNAHPDGLTR